MKLICSCSFSIILTFIISCGVAQNKTSASQEKVENILLELYSKHFKIWEIPSVPSDARYEKIDSLLEKYCTTKFRIKARETYENVGVDFLTNDMIGSLNEDLKVKKDNSDKNIYIVSFFSDVANYADSPNSLNKKKVTLYVTVIRDVHGYKVDDVK